MRSKGCWLVSCLAQGSVPLWQNMAVQYFIPSVPLFYLLSQYIPFSYEERGLRQPLAFWSWPLTSTDFRLGQLQFKWRVEPLGKRGLGSEPWEVASSSCGWENRFILLPLLHMRNIPFLLPHWGAFRSELLLLLLLLCLCLFERESMHTVQLYANHT